MKVITKDHALQVIQLHKPSTRLRRHIVEAKALFGITLEDPLSLSSLIFEQRPGTRLISPTGQPRTLGDVLRRMQEQKWSFESLAADFGWSKDQHNPAFFSGCRDIDTAFDARQFGWLTLVPAIDEERKYSPGGTFYIHDGNHRALVLAKKCLLDGWQLPRVDCLLVIPRPLD